MNIIEHADRDMLALHLAGRLASELNDALPNLNNFNEKNLGFI